MNWDQRSRCRHLIRASHNIINNLLLNTTGTTVNTAARMEATSEGDRIHLSEKTADLLLEAGKKKWVQARKERILVKGVGEIQTYFITRRKSIQTNKNKVDKSSDMASSCSDLSVGSGDLWEEDQENNTSTLMNINTLSVNGQRLVDWQVESLGGLLKKIIAFRNQGRKKRVEKFSLEFQKGETVLDEVQEIIELPEFDTKKSTISSAALALVELSPAVKTQLRLFVEEIASVYHQNPFHNFEVRSPRCLTTAPGAAASWIGRRVSSFCL
jgi:hypothetical protein